MSASKTPTRKPSVLSPSARLTAVVDLPTPPLPLATATMALTPGTIALPEAGAAEVPPGARAGAGRAAEASRSAVSTAVTEETPSSLSTAASAALRRGSI